MSERDQALEAIRELPEDAGYPQIIRELAFMAGVADAREEIQRGEGLDADEAKRRLREVL
jgi:hypothetical protein